MSRFLGLDTSNYTTSIALYDLSYNTVFQKKKLLMVKDGALGLRQSDAVFYHVKQLGNLTEELLLQTGTEDISGIGVSVRPRDVDGSYMPCFLVGELVAQTMASLLKLPLTKVSHQAGHIAAALFSTGQLSLIGKTFAAFHLSGGTTEYLIVNPGDKGSFSFSLTARSLDLKAGQAIDRVGGMLGLKFPSGKQLEKLALISDKVYHIVPTMKGKDCSLSGVENRCRRMLDNGEPHADIARYCIDSILSAVEAMTYELKQNKPELPILYSGGVMSNSIIREAITAKYGGFFAKPEFSSDNAAGVAVLAAVAFEGV